MLELLENLSPVTNMAYVYIQHLDPNANSQLTHILSRVTAMPVREAENQLRIEPNHIYVIPSRQDMEVVDSVLTLLPRQTDARHMPIDQFFISLADCRKEVAIAVVLSGMASDGTPPAAAAAPAMPAPMPIAGATPPPALPAQVAHQWYTSTMSIAPNRFTHALMPTLLSADPSCRKTT